MRGRAFEGGRNEVIVGTGAIAATSPEVKAAADRMDYVASATNNHAYVLVVEKLLGVAATVLVALPWMLQLLVDYTQRLFRSLPAMVG